MVTSVPTGDSTRPGAIPVVPGSEATPERLGDALRVAGCVIVESLLAAEALERIRGEVQGMVVSAPLGDNDFDGRVTRRVFDPLARTRVLDELVLDPLLGGVIEALIGASQLGMTLLSAVQPGEVAQRLHRDAAVYPLPCRFGPVMITTIWAIDDFTAENGATVVATGSHLSERPSARFNQGTVAAAMPAGSVLVYDGRLVHGAGANHTTSGRLGLIVEFVARWLRPNENHTLAVPLAVAAALPAALQELLGYNQHGSYLGLIAGRLPSEWLRSVRGTPRR